jgi:hypothetical protein
VTGARAATDQLLEVVWPACFESARA